jgi:hypothetical protein
MNLSSVIGYFDWACGFVRNALADELCAANISEFLAALAAVGGGTLVASNGMPMHPRRVPRTLSPNPSHGGFDTAV